MGLPSRTTCLSDSRNRGADRRAETHAHATFATRNVRERHPGKILEGGCGGSPRGAGARHLGHVAPGCETLLNIIEYLLRPPGLPSLKKSLCVRDPLAISFACEILAIFSQSREGPRMCARWGASVHEPPQPYFYTKTLNKSTNSEKSFTFNV